MTKTGRPTRTNAAVPNGARILVPLEADIAVTVSLAAQIFHVSDDTMRTRAEVLGVGRRVMGGQWQISLPAALMAADNDVAALRAYWVGQRTGEPVNQYFRRACVLLEKISGKAA